MLKSWFFNLTSSKVKYLVLLLLICSTKQKYYVMYIIRFTVINISIIYRGKTKNIFVDCFFLKFITKKNNAKNSKY